MLMLKRYLVPCVLSAAAAAATVVTAPPAGADCTSSGGVTICAQGSVSGPSGAPVSSGPYYPYPCEDDWLCDDGGVSIVLDPGRPGRPGHRP